MRSLMQRIAADDNGATAIEYGLIAALIVIAILTSMHAFADETIAMWTNVDAKMSASTSAASGG